MNTQLELYATMVKVENKLPLSADELALLKENPAAAWAVRARLESQYLRKQQAVATIFIDTLSRAASRSTFNWHPLEFKAAASTDAAKIISYVGKGWEEGQYLEITLSKNGENQWQVDVRISNDALLSRLLEKKIYLGYGEKESPIVIATLSVEEDQLYSHSLCEWNEAGVNPDEKIAGILHVGIQGEE